MNKITFPGFGMKFEINSIAINLFGIDIYWYAIFIVLAFAIGIAFCKKDDGKYNIKFEDILNILIFLIPISIICARLYFVLFKLDYYAKNPLEIFNIRNGGLAIYGGIIGAVITILVYCKYAKLSVLDVIDYIAPYLPLRTSNWKMGKLCKLRSIWNKNY
jgi:phosphatidylglycerol:prolipoprotein diacylglycerol transferase